MRECILASPRFAFDYYLRSLPESALGKHCEQLMKSSEKYLLVRTRDVERTVIPVTVAPGSRARAVVCIDRRVGLALGVDGFVRNPS